MGKDQELIEAARNGDYPVVEKILSQRAKRSGPLASLRRGPGANAHDSNGYSALHHAALNRHKDIVELLLSHEASTNSGDLQGSSPLHLAAWSGNDEIVRLLLTHGPSVPIVNLANRSSETALHMASQYGHTGVVKMLLQHGADPTITNERQETALDLAAQYGRLEAVQLLLQSHPALLAPYTSPNSSNRGHQSPFPHTPLHSASRNGHRNVVEVLVKAGFDVNVRTTQGTALHEAALCGKVDVVKVLLEANIDVCIADSQRRTAVDRLNEVGLKTPVAKEIADLIRGSLKRYFTGKANSPLCSPHDGTPSPTGMKDGKLPLSQIHDNHSHSDAESGKASRNSYSPSQSPKMNSFSRGKARRSVDVHLVKGPDYDKLPSAPPKKPPRRNLSASPTHPGVMDFSCDNYDLMQLAHMGRNKSVDESVYGERWRKSITGYETSQSTDSIDLSPMEHTKPCAKSDIAFFNGLADDLKTKSKSQHLGLDSQYVSVAHIKLRDAKSEQNVSPSGLRVSQGRSTDDLDHIDGNADTPSPTPPHLPTSSANTTTDHSAKNTTATSTASSGTSGGGQDERKKPLPKGPKPAIAPKPTIAPKPIVVPKPKNIKRQGNSCDNVLDENKPKGSAAKKTTHKSTSMSVLSPVDLDKEWESITKFMDSLNVKMENGDSNKPVRSAVGKWLAGINMAQYEQLLVSAGFDDKEFLGGGILEENSLLEIGMLNAQHRKIVCIHASKLDVSWPRALGADGMPLSVEKWLQELHLEQYTIVFQRNRYTDTERLLRLTNDELTTLLEIESVGHRRRILAASARIPGGNNPAGRANFSQHFENGIATSNTVEPQSDGSLPLRDPNDLVSGVSSALKTAWRHSPETLINGSVTYKAVYVGWSPVQESSTTDCIQKAIQQIRSQEVAVTRANAGNGATMVNFRVTLIVSATIVSWYNAKTTSLVGEHDIGSIQCTCQASDDLRHLALVTRGVDPADKSHTCHVFYLDSVEIATEAILTLGQAFEVAYQLALASRKQNKDQKTHTRSKSANQLSTKSTISANSKARRERYYNMQSSSSSSSVVTNANASHGRSHSVTDIPPPVISAIAKSATNSPQIEPHHKDYGFPRAESFSFSSHSNLTRAPLVSKEEL